MTGQTETDLAAANPAPARPDGDPPVPRSASAAWTGLAGVGAGLLAMLLLRDWLQPVWLKTLCVLASSAVVMVAVDVLVYRTYRNPTTGLSREPLRPLDPLRLFHKLMGFWLTIGVIAAAYAVIPEYAGAFYQPFKDAALRCLPMLLVASPFYVAYVDRRQRDPIDAYAEIGMLLGGRRPESWGPLRTHALGWTVKAFFLPLMFVYVGNGLSAQWAAPLVPSLDSFEHIFTRVIDLLFLIDVSLAAVAYGLTLRVIDTHIRSVEPTLGGWVICLMCYAPFSGVLGNYTSYDQDGLFWGAVFAPYPILYTIWGSAILILIGIYAWATASFGLRFSNLTNRGIITSGPYRWTKHPAYICKNLSWWLISIPFVAGAGWLVAVQSCLLLAAGNLIYFARARTEERHLSSDPAYREYQAFIARDGLFARLAKLRRSGIARRAA
jgi:hypothetical protein